MSVETEAMLHIERMQHIDNALHGAPEPELSEKQEAYEDWSDILVGFHEPNAKELGESLGMKISSFQARDKGNEHTIYVNEDGTKLVKLDHVPVDDYTRKERILVHEAMRGLFPDHFPEMYRSFKTEEGATGIIVERINEHPDFSRAKAHAKNGDPTVMDTINMHPFSSVLKGFEDMGTSLEKDFDGRKSTNYMIDPKGRQIFIDATFLSGEDIVRSKKNINEYMEKKGVATDQATRVKIGMRGLELLIRSATSPRTENAVYRKESN
jgi:hypothetical protein